MATETPRGRARVLLVDDDPGVLETTAALLSETYEVVTAPDGGSALFRFHQQAFDVLCTDYSMPQLTGTDLLRQVRGLRDPIAGILMTGFHEHGERLSRTAETDSFYVLFKPFGPQQLLDTVERAVASIERRRRVQRAAAESKRATSQVVAELGTKRGSR